MKNRKRFTLPSAAALLATLLLTTGSAETSYAQAGAETDIRLPEFIAHRGASWLAPENTMASIQLAWEMDVDAVEIDIYLTADDQIVLFHDSRTGRISDADRLVEEMTLEELQELEVGCWKGEQWPGERVITLDEALATVPKGKRMIIDVKSDTRIVEPMLEAFDRSGLHPHQIVVIAFSFKLAAKTKELRPRQVVLLLESFRRDSDTGEWSPTMEELIEQAREANLDGLNMNFRGPATVEESIRLIREAGLGYYVWTVNDIDAAERAVQLGVDGLTTDRPAWMKKQLLSRNGWKLLKR